METRKPRADAQRNREHIIEVARTVYAECGDCATFEGIVKRSGLGVGTLYRHFKTKAELFEAVYLSEVESLAAKATDLQSELPPLEALQQWMLHFVDYLETKRAMLGSMSEIVGFSPETQSRSRECLEASINGLMENAMKAGQIQPVQDPLDLLRALTGVANNNSTDQWKDSCRRMITLLLSGLRNP